MVVSSQGEYKEDLGLEGEEKVGAERKSPRWQLWFSGPVSRSSSRTEGDMRDGGMAEVKQGARMEVQLEGVLDRGDLYAAQVFTDNIGRRLMWGEITLVHPSDVADFVWWGLG